VLNDIIYHCDRYGRLDVITWLASLLRSVSLPCHVTNVVSCTDSVMGSYLDSCFVSEIAPKVAGKNVEIDALAG
jgi:hypothetical protein